MPQSWPHPDTPGTVYLLHYSAPTRRGRQHYLGWTADIDRRVRQHRSGNGCRETRKAVDEGLAITLAQTWSGTPALEERLKAWSREGRKGFRSICPFCSSGAQLPVELESALGPGSLTRRFQLPSGLELPSP